MEKALEVSHLTKKYGNVIAVSDISFTVKRQEIFALIGPNGAGKSTALKMIATLLTPTSGTISIRGLDVVKQAAQVRELISYLPEDSGAYKNLKGIEYLEFMATLYARNQAEEKIFIARGKEITALGGRLRDKTNTYSKGMIRKLLLARTVMINPKLAILDEPTSGLDVVNALEIRERIRELTKNETTVLLSSHNMLEIEFLSDRVAIIDQGKIHEVGTPLELKKKYHAKNLEEVFVKATENKTTSSRP